MKQRRVVYACDTKRQVGVVHAQRVEAPLTLQEVNALLDMLRVMLNTFMLDDKQEELAKRIQRKLKAVKP